MAAGTNSGGVALAVEIAQLVEPGGRLARDRDDPDHPAGIAVNGTTVNPTAICVPSLQIAGTEHP